MAVCRSGLGDFVVLGEVLHRAGEDGNGSLDWLREVEGSEEGWRGEVLRVSDLVGVRTSVKVLCRDGGD